VCACVREREENVSGRGESDGGGKRQWPKKDKLLYWENRSRTRDETIYR